MTEKDYSLIEDLSFATSPNDEAPMLVYADASPAYDDDEEEENEYDTANSVVVDRERVGGSNSDSSDDSLKIDITAEVPEDQKHLVKPALIGGSVVGLLLGGPIISVLVGCGSAYSVRKQNSALGDIARGLGDITTQVQNKAIEVETKHHVAQNITSSINNYCEEKPKESWINKTRSFTAKTWSSTVEYATRNQLIERGVEGTGRGIEYLSDFFSSSSSSSTTPSKPAPMASE
mmetsp:Transcript_20601/g.48869  ORF Transcript_20601/g.48869 Transcript_20601/m.48869 type:complete len:233 (+) Transcript_20601:86-784(+)